MDITPLTPKDKLVVSHYGNGGFIVSGATHKGNILILHDRVVAWKAAGLKEAAPADFLCLLEQPPEIMLIGTGKMFEPIPGELRNWFKSHSIAVDGMDTGAACRTYSVLLNEGRMVAAALIAV